MDKIEDTIDYSDKIECYCPCPKCGKKNLGFGTTLDMLTYMTSHRQEYISSITCLSCLFRLSANEQQAQERKISIYELNRRMWNEMYKRNKQK